MFQNDMKNKSADFAVIKDFGDSEGFFRLATPGGEVHLPKFEFQCSQPLPDTLNCRIKGYSGNRPILAHNTARYVSEFYADGFQRGQEFEFQVLFQPDKDHPYYRLKDKNGLIFKLHDKSSVLATGQKVLCRFERLDAYGFSVRRSNTDTNLPMMHIKDLMKGAQLYSKVNPRDIEQLLLNTPELHDAAADYEQNRAVWILAAIRAIDTNISSWFVSNVLSVPVERVDTLLRAYRNVCLYLLQGSSFLRNLGHSERHGLQDLLSSQIDRIEILIKALTTIARGDSEKFVRRLLENLKQSGYLFHPQVELSVMMILFRVNPDLVNASLRNIFDTLMEWNPQTWKEEPFRRAFVDQLEIFISDAVSDIDSFMQPQNRAEINTVENVLTAIAIQRQLANFTDKNLDLRMNMATFYRFLSVLRPAKADTLLNKSFLTLMGVNLPVDFTWTEIKETSMMMTRATVDAPRTAVIPESATKYFASGNVLVEVGASGIVISRNDSPVVDNALPSGIIDWPETAIKINAGYAFTSSKLKQLDKHREFWNAIEEKLMAEREVAPIINNTVKHVPDIDDQVYIKVERVTLTPDGFLMNCVIDDPTYEGRGLLRPDGIINYNIRELSIGTFRDNTGQPLLLPAIVDDIDDNDNLIFSLLPYTEEKIRELASVGDTALCVITRKNLNKNQQPTYSAISERGYGLFVRCDDDMPPLRNGNVIRYTVTGYNSYYDSVQGEYDEGPVDVLIENNRCVRAMMLAIAVEPEDSEPQEVQIDDDDAMTAQEMKQLIEIVRYKALSLRHNLVKVYDCLSLARLLALIAGDKHLSEEIYAHLRAVELYQSFDKNRQIFHNDIDRVIDLAPHSPLVAGLCRRLQIVASLGNPDDNAELWSIVHDPELGDSYKDLAQMVLSYNFLNELDHNDEAAAQIKDNIARMLNVVSEQRDLKYYGSESQYVEFKSSLVYPAIKGKSGISVADPDKQEFEILHIIAGFLNTRGGTLYIGVGDDHYERGLSEDYTYYKKAANLSAQRRGIRTPDNLANYLQQLIDRSFTIMDIPGNRIAGEYAKTGVDDEATKGVVMVKIDPCPYVVYLDGKIYARHGAKTEPYTDPEEIQAFIADRESYYHNFCSSSAKSAEAEKRPAAASPAAPASKATAGAAESSASTKDNNITQPDAEEPQSFAPVRNYTIGTTIGCHNVIHEYEDPDNYVTPEFYIRFVGDSRYVITTDEWSVSDTDSLALAVKADDVDNYLVMLFDDLSAIKVPIREIMQKDPDIMHNYSSDHKLIFAAPASDSDALYGILSNAKASVLERMTPVSEIARGSITSTPVRLLESEVTRNGGWTIVPPSKQHLFSQALSTGMKRSQVGVLVKGLGSNITIEAALAQLVEKLK